VGNITFTSTTSGAVYNTAVGTGVPAEDANIVNKGQDGMFYWLGLDSVLGTYNIKKSIWDTIITDFNNIETGWTSAGETWTYASASTITVPSGAASKYQKGDKIRFKQGATYKYFYIITVADTLLTVTGGSDYTVATPTAITDNYYSHSENPLGFPIAGFALTAPTWTTTGTAFTNQPTNDAQSIRILNGICDIWGQITTHATSGGTNIFIATFASAQVPVLVSDKLIGYSHNYTDAFSGFAYCHSTAVVRLAKYDGSAMGANSKVIRYHASFTF